MPAHLKASNFDAGVAMNLSIATADSIAAVILGELQEPSKFEPPEVADVLR